MNVSNCNNFNHPIFLHDYPIVLRRIKRCRIQQFLCTVVSIIESRRQFLYGLIKPAFFYGFQQIIYCIYFKSFNCIFVESCSKDHCRMFIHQLQHLKAVNLRHLNVQKYKIRLMLRNGLNAFKSITAFCNNLNIGKTA
ncbi:hypothetical protein D3C86_1814510 [compost metagenome]